MLDNHHCYVEIFLPFKDDSLAFRGVIVAALDEEWCFSSDWCNQPVEGGIVITNNNDGKLHDEETVEECAQRICNRIWQVSGRFLKVLVQITVPVSKAFCGNKQNYESWVQKDKKTYPPMVKVGACKWK
jgi:hypothetical protein